MDKLFRKPRMKVDGRVVLKEYCGRNTLKNSLLVELVNISQSGMAIISERKFQIGQQFETEISFDSEFVDYNLMKVVRVEELEEKYLYGCQFVELQTEASSKESLVQRAI